MVELVRNNPLTVFALIVINIMLSLWAYYADPVINNDGVVYVSVANLILNGNWQEAFAAYSWPFYPAIIAGVAKLFWIDAETAAYLLNGVFIILLTFAFTNVVGELSGYDRRIMLIALVVVVVFPSITKYRAYIIRDFGYLAFYLWSLYYLLRFCRDHKKQYLMGWIALAGASCLFRFEGIAFLLISPYFLVLFVGQDLQHRKTILRAGAALILVAALGALSWYVQNKYTATLIAAGHAGLNITSLSDLFFHNLSQRYGDGALTSHGFVNVILGTTGDVVYETLRRLAVVYFVFAVYAIYLGLVLKSPITRRIWAVYLVTNLCLLIGFSLFNSFLVSRYTMATALTLLLCAPFAIDHLLRRWPEVKWFQKAVIGLAFLVVSVVSIEGLDVSTNKRFVRTGGEWIAQNLPPNASLYSNSRLLIYYSGAGTKANLNEEYSNTRFAHYLKIGHIDNFDYIAVEVDLRSKLENDFRQTLWFKYGRPVVIFEGSKDRVLIIHSTKICPAATVF